MARYPRRTCEATFDRLMNCIWLDGSKGFKKNMNFEDIAKLTYELIKEEKENKELRRWLSNPYH